MKLHRAYWQVVIFKSFEKLQRVENRDSEIIKIKNYSFQKNPVVKLQSFMHVVIRCQKSPLTLQRRISFLKYSNYEITLKKYIYYKNNLQYLQLHMIFKI